MKNLIEQFIMMAPDFDGAGGGSEVSDSLSTHTADFNVGAEDDDAGDDDYPVHEYGRGSVPAEIDEETDDNQDEGSEENKGDDQDPATNEDTGEEGDPAGESEEEPESVNTDLLLRAGRLGLDKVQVDLYSQIGNEAFKSHLDNVEALGQRSGQIDNAGGNQDTGDYEAPTAYEPTLDGEWDDELVGDLRGMSEHFNKQTESTHALLQNVASSFISDRYNQVDAVVNEEIEALTGSSMGFEESLGAGTDGLVAKGSIAETNRGKVVSEIQKIQLQRNQEGRPPMTTDRAFAEAVRIVTGKDVNQNKKSTNGKMRKRSAVASVKSGRKTSTRNEPENGYAESVDIWDKGLRS